MAKWLFILGPDEEPLLVCDNIGLTIEEFQWTNCVIS